MVVFPSSSCNRYSLFIPSSSPLLRQRKPAAPATTLAKNPTTVNARRSPFYGVLQLHLMNLRITRKPKLSHYRFYPPISGTKMTFPCRRTSAIYHRSRVSSPMICFSSRTRLPYPTCFLNRILYPTAITCYSDQVLLIMVSDLHPGP